MELLKKFWEEHKVAIITGLWRIARGTLALIVSLIVVEVTKDQNFVWLAPFLLGVDKAVREWSVK